MSDNTEVIPRQRSDVVPAGEAAIMMRPLLELIPKITDATEDDIALRILRSETLEEAFAGLDTVGIVDVLDERIQLTALRYGDSDFDGGLGVYLVVEYLDGKGKRGTLSVGAVTVMIQLLKANALGAIPGLRVIPRKAKTPTKNGFYPYHLELVS